MQIGLLGFCILIGIGVFATLIFQRLFGGRIDKKEIKFSAVRCSEPCCLPMLPAEANAFPGVASLFVDQPATVSQAAREHQFNMMYRGMYAAIGEGLQAMIMRAEYPSVDIPRESQRLTNRALATLLPPDMREAYERRVALQNDNDAEEQQRRLARG